MGTELFGCGMLTRMNKSETRFRGIQKLLLARPRALMDCHIVSRYYDENAIIWNREKRAIVWRSTHKHVPDNKIESDFAETVIRSCSQQAPHLWPKSFPAYCNEDYAYCKQRGCSGVVKWRESSTLHTKRVSVRVLYYERSAREDGWRPH